jgi:altronate hydrolase
VNLRSCGIRKNDGVEAFAGGKKNKSELSEVGEEEFAPWSIGPTL